MSLVQSAKASTGGATSRTCAFSSQTTAGNLLICKVGNYNISANMSIADNGGGDSWSYSQQNYENSQGGQVTMGAKLAVGGVTPTVTVSASTSTPIDVIIEEHSPDSGYAFNTATADVTSANNGISGTSMTTGSATPSAARCLLVACGYDATGYRSGMAAGTDGQGHNMTATQHCQNTDDEGFMGSYVGVTAAAAFNCTFTGITSGDRWTACFAAYAMTASGGGGSNLPAIVQHLKQQGIL